MRKVKMVKVDPKTNSNAEFYMMEKDGKVEYGIRRSGTSRFRPQHSSVSFWDKIYQDHIQKGFVPVDENAVMLGKDSGFADIADPYINDFMQKIVRFSKLGVSESYSVSVDAVTPKMLKEAQETIREIDAYTRRFLSPGSAIPGAVSNMFTQLYIQVPRKMKEVSRMFPKRYQDILSLLEYNQELLDNLSLQQEINTHACGNQKTVLDRYHLKASVCTGEETEMLKKMLAKESVKHFKRALKISSEVSEKRMENFMTLNGYGHGDLHYLFHGTKNMNVLPILAKGLLLNPDAPITGKMFGYGLYFANRAKKSINYSSLNGSYWANGQSDTGYLLVFKVLYQHPKHVERWFSHYSSLNRASINPYDAVYAHKGADLVNDEIIVYDEAQVSLAYVIELK